MYAFSEPPPLLPFYLCILSTFVFCFFGFGLPTPHAGELGEQPLFVKMGRVFLSYLRLINLEVRQTRTYGSYSYIFSTSTFYLNKTRLFLKERKRRIIFTYQECTQDFLANCECGFWPTKWSRTATNPCLIQNGLCMTPYYAPGPSSSEASYLSFICIYCLDVLPCQICNFWLWLHYSGPIDCTCYSQIWYVQANYWNSHQSLLNPKWVMHDSLLRPWTLLLWSVLTVFICMHCLDVLPCQIFNFWLWLHYSGPIDCNCYSQIW